MLAAWMTTFVLMTAPAVDGSARQPLGQLALFSPLVGREWVAAFPGTDADGENHGSADQLDRVRSTIRIGTDEWTSVGTQQRGGQWVEQPARTYRPVR
jgi:hypothetical protein